MAQKLTSSVWPARFSMTLGLLSLTGITLWLWPFWNESAELSHGFFALPLCLWLFWHSRKLPKADIPKVLTVVLGLTFLAGIGTALAALAQGVQNGQTAFLAALTTAGFLTGLIGSLVGTPKWSPRLNGASICAALLWVFSAPLPSGTLSRLTLFLQDRVAATSLSFLNWFGIPAVRHGNVLELASQWVGVEEACSGIRSLTACLFVGTVLAGFRCRGFPRRFFLIISAGVLAIATNLLRSITLCFLAARGVRIEGFWHDTTAFAILVVTSLALYGMTALIGQDDTQECASIENIRPGLVTYHPWIVNSLGFLLLAMGLFVWVRALPQPSDLRPAPNLHQLLVFEVPGWEKQQNPDIYKFSRALNTDELLEVTYSDGKQFVTLYMAFWRAGQSTLGSVGLHSPEVCYPGAGWTAVNPSPLPGDTPFGSAPVNSRFEYNHYAQNVWFWHFYGNENVGQLPGLYPWQLGRFLVAHRVSSRAAQWVVRISSNQPLANWQHNPVIVEFERQMKEAGLTGNNQP